MKDRIRARAKAGLRARVAISIAAASLSFFRAGSARADDSEISAPSLATLELGAPIVYQTMFERGERRLVGGVVYALLPVSAKRAYAVLHDRERFLRYFPRLRAARIVGEMPPDVFVEFEYSAAAFLSVHTLRIRYVDRDHSVHFWLDPRFSHDIRDAWGYFRLVDDPTDARRSVLTYGALVDLGLGPFDMVIEERVRNLLLSVPERMQRDLAATK